MIYSQRVVIHFEWIKVNRIRVKWNNRSAFISLEIVWLSRYPFTKKLFENIDVHFPCFHVLNISKLDYHRLNNDMLL